MIQNSHNQYMKKIVFFLTISLFTVLCNAQSYKGFIEGGRTFFTGPEGSEYHTTDFMTTHGVQFNRLFVGAGAGVRWGDVSWLPIYANARYDFTSRKIAPFVDAKIGYTFIDMEGFYACPSIGVSWNFCKFTSVFFKVGYTYNPMKDGDVDRNGVTVMAGFSF